MVVAAVLFWAATAHAQSTAATYPFRIDSIEETGGHTQVVAHNDGPITVSVQVHMQGRNAKSDQSWPLTVAVPAFSVRELAHVSPVDPSQGYEFKFQSVRIFGDLNALIDANAFRLPFQSGQQHVVSQAYGGKLTTHQDPKLQYAVDFDMPENTPVLAARQGWVAEVVSGFTAGGVDPQFADKANVVKVLHADGTVASYGHLSPRTVPLQVGQVVQAGELIGYSGNTGYSSGPHLHFCVSKPTLGPQGLLEVCLPVKFATAVSAEGFTPQEGMRVSSDSGPSMRRAHDRSLVGESLASNTGPDRGGLLQLSAGSGLGWLAALAALPWWCWLVLVLLLCVLVWRGVRAFG